MSLFATKSVAAAPPERSSPRRANPFVGPVPFTADDSDYFFGREFETRELTALLGAERVVLLYSPSGAGKTSLIQARLIRALERQRFDVLPLLRVSKSRASRTRGDGEPATHDSNRYLESILTCLGWMGSDSAAIPDLKDFLHDRPLAAEKKGQVLIIDQLEEILTLDPADLPAKREFFRQLGETLAVEDEAEDPNSESEQRSQRVAPRVPYWALLVVREDYLGALDPYLPYLPSRLTTFRINLLDEKKTLAAIQGPARMEGVAIPDDAAKAIFESLCRRDVLRPGRQEPETIQSPFVEPVHLQIVCKEIIGDLQPGAQTVSVEDLLARPGGIDRIDAALTAYYRSAVVQSASRGPTTERAIRLWVDEYLITRYGLRGQFNLDPEVPGLPLPAIESLIDAGVIRSEERNGVRWLELSHDRLVRPIRNDNESWYGKNLSPLQLAAIAWDRADRPDQLLLRGKALDDAIAWGRDNACEESDLDREFLDQSNELRRNERNRVIGWGVFGLILVSLLMVLVKNQEMRKHQKEIEAKRTAAQVNYLAAKSQDSLDENFDVALLCASSGLELEMAEAAKLKAYDVDSISAARDAAKRVLLQAGGRSLIGHTGPVTIVTLTPDWVVSASQDGTVRLWDFHSILNKKALTNHFVLEHGTRPITWIALSADKTQLATVSYDKRLCVWNLDRSRLPNMETASTDNRPVRLKPEWTSQEVDFSLTRVAFVPTSKGTCLCAAGGGLVHFWRLNGTGDNRPADRTYEAHRSSQVTAIAIPPQGHGRTGESLLATGSRGGDVRIWSMDRVLEDLETGPGGPSDTVESVSRHFEDAHPGGTADLSFFRDGEQRLWMASAGNDRSAANGRTPLEAAGSKRQGGSIRFWRVLEAIDTGMIAGSRKLTGFNRGIVDIAVEQGLLVSGDTEGKVCGYRVDDLSRRLFLTSKPEADLADEGFSQMEDVTPHSHASLVTDIDISQDGRWVASSAADGTVFLRNVETRAFYTIHLGNGANGVSLEQVDAAGTHDPKENPTGGISGRIFLVTACSNEIAKVWNSELLPQETKELGIHLPPIASSQVSDKGGDGPTARGSLLDKHGDDDLRDALRSLIASHLSEQGVETYLKVHDKTGLIRRHLHIPEKLGRQSSKPAK